MRLRIILATLIELGNILALVATRTPRCPGYELEEPVGATKITTARS